MIRGACNKKFAIPSQMDEFVATFISEITENPDNLEEAKKILELLSDVVQECHKKTPPNYVVLYLQQKKLNVLQIRL